MNVMGLSLAAMHHLLQIYLDRDERTFADMFVNNHSTSVKEGTAYAHVKLLRLHYTICTQCHLHWQYPARCT